ncbi:MAG: hypothetical protein ABI334_09375 [Candidatus Dormiibacterota bacterium]
MSRLVERYGMTGGAAITSAIWAVPMAAWAGSSDLSPIDKTAYPWIALGVGIAMFAVWLFLLTRISRIAVTPRQRRFDLAQLSRSEKRWTLATVAFGAGLIAWLNAAATVDWGPLGTAIGAGEAGPIIFAVLLAAFLIVMVAGIWISWRKESGAFARRTGR